AAADMVGLLATVAEKRQIPQRVDARALFSEAGNRLEAIDGRRVFREVPGCHVDLDAGRPDGEVVRVDRGDEEIVQPFVQSDAAAPAVHTGRDLIVGAGVVIDGTLEEQVGLTLRWQGRERGQ